MPQLPQLVILLLTIRIFTHQSHFIQWSTDLRSELLDFDMVIFSNSLVSWGVCALTADVNQILRVLWNGLCCRIGNILKKIIENNTGKTKQYISPLLIKNSDEKVQLILGFSSKCWGNWRQLDKTQFHRRVKSMSSAFMIEQKMGNYGNSYHSRVGGLLRPKS